jgi:cystathionine beta-lyase
MDEQTRLIRAGAPAHSHGPAAVTTVSPVIQKGSTVLLPNAAALYDDTAYVTYGRGGLVAHNALKEGLCVLEGARSVSLYPSGLAALTGAMLAVLKAGDDILVVDNIYKPTRRFCDEVLRRYGVGVRYFDPRLPPEALLDLAGAATRMIVLESPGSLTFEMQDLASIATLARARGILTLAENTWGAGLIYKPLAHGIDISVQALTKYVGGHSDVFMGSAAVSDLAIGRLLEEGIVNLGWACAPEDAYQMLRGLRTLEVRMTRQGQSSLKVAAWLRDQPEVLEVLHPALPGCPDHDLWARDYSGTCALFGFILTPASEAAVNALLDGLKLFGLGFSWGGFESLAISCDHQLPNRSLPQTYAGPVMRLHIGLEDPDDLIGDLREGLDAFNRARA